MVLAVPRHVAGRGGDRAQRAPDRRVEPRGKYSIERARLLEPRLLRRHALAGQTAPPRARSGATLERRGHAAKLVGVAGLAYRLAVVAPPPGV